jgi:hypothetical protein
MHGLFVHSRWIGLCGTNGVSIRLVRPHRAQKLLAVAVDVDGRLKDLPLGEYRADPSETVLTVTFRISAELKERVEAAALRREVTSTRIFVDALHHELDDEPPRWAENLFVRGILSRRWSAQAPEESLTALVKAYVVENPRGVAAWEVGRRFDVSGFQAYDALLRLAERGEIRRHSRGKSVLWTPLEKLPIPRVKTRIDAILSVLRAAAGQAVDQLTLLDSARLLLRQSMGRNFSSVGSEILRACRFGIIKKVGSGTRGPLYQLAEPSKEEVRMQKTR